MSQEDAIIRPYNHQQEDKLVRFMVGKACMEPLADANRKATTHPWTIAVWILISSVFVQIMAWWPDDQHGFLGYLRPLPAFAVSSLPLIFLIDWYQRPAFEEESVEVLKRPDIVDIEDYYARSPSSGVWICELGKKFVGLIAVDASADSLSNQTLISRVEETTGKVKGKRRMYSKGAASTASIRHLYVAEPYRVAGAQDELIAFAVKRVFNTSSAVERIRATPSPLSTYVGRALKDAGFVVAERGPKIGVLGWTTLSYELTRDSTYVM